MKDERITVSVIIPIYNAEEIIVKSINNVLKQSLNNIEIICVDDGSSDHSLDILKMYESERFVVLSQDNSGAGIARNKGISVARGEYLSFMDIDDCYSDFDSLEILYTNAKRNKAKVCCGNLLTVKANGETNKCEDYFDFSGWIDYRDYQMRYHHQRFLFQRKFLIENGFYYPKYLRYQDPPFLVRVLNFVKKIYVIPNVVYHYIYTFSLKKVSYERVCDALDGVAEILAFSKKEKLGILHNKVIQDANSLAKYVYYHCADSPDKESELKRKVMAIHENICPALMTGVISFESKEYMSIINANKYLEELCKKARKSDKVVLYGAGVIQKRLSQFLNENGIVIDGIAISGEPEPDSVERNISEFVPYCNDALIIVSTTSKFHKEISEVLNSYHFKNVILLDADALNYVMMVKEIGYL